ncbi:serine racemase [Prunus yedoensis var. nudiflora]|uniref:Serine racemase n=1 Tax=Prunus yedoensis var. nudiflora TaxID=2094558 RepID=A0A314XVP2_PRUYE|nr:serine racemase [Prunus yedoensis var. nudiflora]
MFSKGWCFQIQRACNAVFSLDDDRAVKGVVTHSSGNHAAALSLAAKLRGIPAYIVIPKNAPKCKVENVIVTVVSLSGVSPQCSQGKVLQPSGQGTISLEFLEQQVPQLDTIKVPIRGGLISGVALAAKAINPAIRVLAAEPERANDAAQSKAAGRIIILSETNTDYDCVHIVFTLPLVNCILDFDLGYLLGIRDQSGGFEVDNGHTGKEENFCNVYGQELESLRALLLSPRAHSKGLGAIDVLVSFPIIGEFYVGGLPIQQQ